MGATVCTDAMQQEFMGEGKAFLHGHSYAGNPLACAAAVANLEIFETEDVFVRIKAITARHEMHLARLRSSSTIDDVRQIGTVAAIELKAKDPGYFSQLKPRLYRFFLEKGVLLRPLGNVIYVMPPYVITTEELDRVYSVIEEGVTTIPNR